MTVFNMGFSDRVLTREQKIEMLVANMRRRDLEIEMIREADRIYCERKREEELRNNGSTTVDDKGVVT